MHAVIKVDMDNDAFYEEPGQELARILRRFAGQVDAGTQFDGTQIYALRDVNGNKVGEAIIRREGD